MKQPVREKRREVRRSVARQVVGQDVYLIGPAAGDDLVPETQLTGPPMRAAIKFLVPYSAALARAVLPAKKAAGPALDARTADARTRIELSGARGKPGVARRIRRARVAEPDEPALDPARTGIEPLVLKVEMAAVLDQFRYAGLDAVEVTVRPARGGLVVSAPGLDGDAVGRLRDGIEQSYALVQMLDKFSRVGKSVTVRAGVRRGLIDLESLTMAY